MDRKKIKEEGYEKYFRCRMCKYETGYDDIGWSKDNLIRPFDSLELHDKAGVSDIVGCPLCGIIYSVEASEGVIHWLEDEEKEEELGE